MLPNGKLFWHEPLADKVHYGRCIHIDDGFEVVHWGLGAKGWVFAVICSENVAAGFFLSGYFAGIVF